MAVRKSNGVVAVVAAFVITSSTFVTQQGVAEDNLRCRKSEFLTANRTLLPLNNITAFNLDLSEPLVRFVDENTMPWCSYFYGSNPPIHQPNHLNMTFTKPVVVEGITSRGSFNLGYVSNFSVFVPPSLDSNKELELLDEEFTPPSQLRVYMIVDSFVAQRVQFRINRIGQSTAWFCWQIQLVGCVAENAVVTNTGTDQPSCSRTTSASRITVQPSCSLVATTTSFVTVQPSCTVSVGGAGAARQSAANGVIGGGAVLLVVGVVLMVVAVIIVLVVVLTRKKSSHGSVNLQPQSHVENGRSQTILKIENVDLYTSNSHDDGLLTNQLYDMDESTLAEPGCDAVQSVQTVTKPSPNYDTAVGDRQVENERNIYSSIHDAMDSTDKQQDQTTPTVTHRNQTSQVNDERYCEVAFNTSKGEDSGAADVYASIDT